MSDLSVDLIFWRLSAERRRQVEDLVDKIHFTVILNGAVFMLILLIAPSALDAFDPTHGIGSGTFALRLIGISLPVWCLTFGAWRWRVIRDRQSLRRRRQARET